MAGRGADGGGLVSPGRPEASSQDSFLLFEIVDRLKGRGERTLRDGDAARRLDELRVEVERVTGGGRVTPASKERAMDLVRTACLGEGLLSVLDASADRFIQEALDGPLREFFVSVADDAPRAERVAAAERAVRDIVALMDQAVADHGRAALRRVEEHDSSFAGLPESSRYRHAVECLKEIVPELAMKRLSDQAAILSREVVLAVDGRRDEN